MFQGVLKFGAPMVYPSVLAAMLIVVFGAVLGPARRATRIDPTAALRND
jgi:ABC-type antimicrobial peptide transport system permease subunit